MVQRLTYRRRHAYNTKANSVKPYAFDADPPRLVSSNFVCFVTVAHQCYPCPLLDVDYGMKCEDTWSVLLLLLE